MKTLRQRVDLLIEKKRVTEFPIFLFGNTSDTYEAIKILNNNHIYPQGIITTQADIKKHKKLYGINLYTHEQVLCIHKEHAYILINKHDYKVFGKNLLANGYVKNKNLFINYTVKQGISNLLSSIYLYGWKIQLIPHRITLFKHRIKHKINNIKVYAKQILRTYYGFKTYRKISKTYGEKKNILVYDYTGLGDVYVMCMLLKANYSFDEEYILTVIGNGCKKVAQLFGINNIVMLTSRESCYLSHFTRFYGEKYNISNITPFPAQVYTEIISHSLAGRKINMFDIYKYEMLNLPKEAKFVYPVIENDNEYVDKLFIENNLNPHKTVILSPYANTVIGYPLTFWSDLIERLKKLNYSVCTNCNGKEKELPGTIRLSFPLDKAKNVLDNAGYFIGLRSGFCDIVCNSNCKKIIIYPQYDIFNSSVYEFCSFKKMGIGSNYKEVRWTYDKMDKLVDTILVNMK